MSNRTAQTRLTREEVAAMWFYHEDYAALRIGAKEFYAGLSARSKRVVHDMIKAIMEAKPNS